MRKNVLISGLVSLVVMASILTCLGIHHGSQTKSREKDASLIRQEAQIAQLIEDNSRLSNTANVTALPKDQASDELPKLRTKVESLQQQIATVHEKQGTNPAIATSAETPVHHTEEYWKQLHALAGDKERDAMELASALMGYAFAHDGQFPASFDQARHYLRKEKELGANATSEFEIIYFGTMHEVKNLPSLEIPLVRQRQAWPGPDGIKMARIYGMMGGACRVIKSDDNFQSWEAEHVINVAQGGQTN